MAYIVIAEPADQAATAVPAFTVIVVPSTTAPTRTQSGESVEAAPAKHAPHLNSTCVDASDDWCATCARRRRQHRHLNPTPFTLHHEPDTRHPTPDTLNLTTYTL